MNKEPFKIPSFSIVTAFICIMLIGIGLLPLLPFRSRATAELPTLTVRFYTRSYLSPRIVENEITNKLEQVLSRTDNLIEISSQSKSESGVLTLKLSEGSDLDEAKLNISAALRKVWKQISDKAYYPSVYGQKAERGRSAFMKYSLSADLPVNDLIQYAEHEIVPKLLLTKGVKSVDYNQADNRCYLLRYDAEQLEKLQIDPNRIVSAINSANKGKSVGLVPHSPGSEPTMMRRLSVQSSMTIPQIMGLTVTSTNGEKYRLSSLMEIIQTDDNYFSDTRINGQNTIFIFVTAKPDANEMMVGEKVRQIFSEIEAKVPDGIVIRLQDDASENVKSELQNIIVRSSITILILIIFIFITVRNLKVIAATIVSLFASILIAVIGYYLFKVEMNVYALAAVTISLSLMIDNFIVMSNQIMTKRNIKAFQPMLAATLTTIGALSIVFFLPEAQKVTLMDFAYVLIINLTVSLFTATFFLPAMMNRMNIIDTARRRQLSLIYVKAVEIFNRYYEKLIGFLSRHRAMSLVVLVLSFGLPAYMLPTRIYSFGMRKESKATEIYNKTFGSKFYNENLRDHVNKYLGGALYKLHSTRPEKSDDDNLKIEMPVISITGSQPEGGTNDMVDIPIRRMENVLKSLSGIKKFETNINGNKSASISVYFDQENISKGAPLSVWNTVTKAALQISGIRWSMFGPNQAQFYNTPPRNAGREMLVMRGYNYDDLSRYAYLMRDSLEAERRVRNVTISSNISGRLPDYAEFDLKLSEQALKKYDITSSQVYNALLNMVGENGGTIKIDPDGRAQLQLTSSQSADYDQWDVENRPLNVGGKDIKISELATFTKHIVPMEISKWNQQYNLFIYYDYKGDDGRKWDMTNGKLKSFRELLPMGYKAEYFSSSGRNEKKLSPLLILIVIAIIYLTTAVLLNSLIQPFAIILVIPVSFIGLFLAFGMYKLPFNEGAIAAMVLLCGLTVNSSIYLTNEYNVIRANHANLPRSKAFVKAWNNKISPIFLTILSTILGFVPFLIGNKDTTGFWYTFSVGTIAGLITSMAGIFFFLPAFLTGRTGRNKLKTKKTS